jgi:hypothetical protein
MTSCISCDFTNANWQPKQLTIGLFEITEIIAQTMAMKLQALLDKYNLWKKTLTYVKDERSNLGAITIALKFVVSCDNLRLEEPFQGTYFGHTMSKAC